MLQWSEDHRSSSNPFQKGPLTLSSSPNLTIFFQPSSVFISLQLLFIPSTLKHWFSALIANHHHLESFKNYWFWSPTPRYSDRTGGMQPGNWNIYISPDNSCEQSLGSTGLKPSPVIFLRYSTILYFLLPLHHFLESVTCYLCITSMVLFITTTNMTLVSESENLTSNYTPQTCLSFTFYIWVKNPFILTVTQAQNWTLERSRHLQLVPCPARARLFPVPSLVVSLGGFSFPFLLRAASRLHGLA